MTVNRSDGLLSLRSVVLLVVVFLVIAGSTIAGHTGKEPNGSASAAATIHGDVTQSTEIGDASNLQHADKDNDGDGVEDYGDDLDWYRFYVDTDQVNSDITAQITQDDNANIDLRVYSSITTEDGSDDDGLPESATLEGKSTSTSDTATESVTLSQGSLQDDTYYYILVYAPEGQDCSPNCHDGTYTLSLDGVPDNYGPDADATKGGTSFGGDTSVVEGNTDISFDGTDSSDPEGDSLTYTWTFGDGTTGSGSTTTYDYAGAVSTNGGSATYKPDLEVDDGTDTDTDSDFATITVYNDYDGDGLADDDSATGVSTDSDDDNDGLDDGTDPARFNQYPSASSDTQSTDEDSTLAVSDGASGDLKTLASDTEGDPITIEQIEESTFSPGSAVTLASGATVTVNSDGSYDYDPNGQFENLDSGDSTTDSFTYTVSDDKHSGDSAATSQETVTVTVNGANDDPTATTGSAKSVEKKTSFSFDATGSSDVDADDTLSYDWDVDDDDTYELSGAQPTHSYASTGTYTVTLRVTDSTGATDTDSVTVDVSGGKSDTAPPTADAGKNITVDLGERAHFDASNSSDDLEIKTWQWDFDGDGHYDKSGRTERKRFTKAGNHTVTLRVIDDAQKMDTDTVTVTVRDPAPTAVTGENRSVSAGKAVTLDASESSDNGEITAYEWDIDGDGATDATGERVTHAFASSGAHTVELTVTDDQGKTATDTVTVYVTDESAPNAVPTVNRSTVTNGSTVTFHAGRSDDDGEIATYAWDFNGDGRPDANGETVRYAFQTTGDHRVTLRVTDAAGNTATETVAVTVQAPAGPTTTRGSTAAATESTGSQASVTATEPTPPLTATDTPTAAGVTPSGRGTDAAIAEADPLTPVRTTSGSGPGYGLGTALLGIALLAARMLARRVDRRHS